MKKGVMAAVVVVAVIALALPAVAEDFVATPIADHPGVDNVEAHFIWWDLGGPPGPENAQIYELFAGLTDRLEVDLERWHFKGMDSINVVNFYWWAINESPSHPSLVLGATNLTGQPLPPSPEGWCFDKRVNPFVISAYNLLTPSGPPRLSDPLVRVYGGYGWNWHDNDPFGGVQIVVSPRVGVAVLNYQGQPAYMVGFKPTARTEIHAGTFHGEWLGHIGWNFNWDLE